MRHYAASVGDLKDLLIKSGLPMPLFNASVFDGGIFIARPDAWWPELGVAVEVDSREWHMSPEDHASTLARGRRMAVHQMVVLRFTPKQIRSQPSQVVTEIRRALDGARGRPLLILRTVPASETLGRQPVSAAPAVPPAPAAPPAPAPAAPPASAAPPAPAPAAPA